MNHSKYYSSIMILILLILSIQAYAGNKITPFEFESWQVNTDGQIATYVPTNLRKGEIYKIEIFPAEKLKGKAFFNWFNSRIDQDAGHIKRIKKRQKSKNHNNAYATGAIRYSNNKGKTRYYIYFGYHLKGKRGQLVRTHYSKMRVFKRYSSVFDTLGQKIFYPTRYQAKLKAAQDKVLAKQLKKQKEQKLKTARWTAPNKGVKKSQIEALVHHLDIEVTGMGARGVNSNYLLLKGGSVYNNLEVPPSDFNVKVSKSMEPERWSRWRRSWGQYQIKNQKTGKWEKLEGEVVKPGKSNTNINVSLKHVSAWGNAFGGGHSRKRIELKSNGRFEKSKFSMATGGSIDGQVRATAWAGANKQGKSSGTAGTAPNVALSKNPSSAQGAGDNAGTYVINGYTIEFQRSSGKTSRHLFYYYKKSIYIDDTLYLIK